MKNYEVLVKAYCTVVVQDVENADEAIELAFDNVNRGDFEIEDLQIVDELATEEVTVRYCNRVI